MTDGKPKKLNLNLDADLVAWCSYVAGLRDTSVTAYINDAVRRDRDAATGAVAEGYGKFLEAREEAGA